MNRIKLWIYMLLLLGAGVANLYFLTGRLTARSLTEVNESLDAASAQLEVRTRLLARTTASVAGMAARHPEVRQVFKADSKDKKRKKIDSGMVALVPAIRAALGSVGEENSVDLSRALAYVVDETGSATHCIGPKGFETDLARFVHAVTASSRQSYALLGKGFWYLTSVAINDTKALVVGFSLDEAWANEVRQATNVDLLLTYQLEQILTTLPEKDAQIVMAAARRAGSKPGVPVDVGLLPPFKLPFTKYTKSIPPLPLLMDTAPAYRAQAITVPGVEGALVILVEPTRAVLKELANYQHIYVGLLALAGLVGIIMGLLVTSGESPAQVPKELASAADKIGQGEFHVRAPPLAGRLGTISNALNHAAEAASKQPVLGSPNAPAPDGAKPLDAADSDFLARGDTAASQPPLADTVAAPSPASGKASSDDPFSNASTVSLPPRTETALDYPAPAPAPAPVPEAAAGSSREPEPSIPPPIPPLPSPAQAATPEASAEHPEEEAWRQVFDEFMAMRQECGESLEGLTYERFRGKLVQNREQLISKYGCRSVRFQVYVKEGRAALKATPVR